MTKITRKQANRAIYIDFEGNKDKAPSFLGLFKNDKHCVLLIEESFKLLERPVKGFAGCEKIYVGKMQEALRELLSRANREDRHIISFSHHEKKMFDKHVSDKDLIAQFNKRYIDGLAVLKRWEREHPDRLNHGERSLSRYCEIANLPEPVAPTRGLGQSLRDLRPRLESVKRWKNLPERWQTLAADVINYNRDDCQRLKELVLIAAKSRKRS